MCYQVCIHGGMGMAWGSEVECQGTLERPPAVSNFPQACQEPLEDDALAYAVQRPAFLRNLVAETGEERASLAASGPLERRHIPEARTKMSA